MKIYLNFSDLGEETQQYLLEKAEKDIVLEVGKKELEEIAKSLNISLNDYLLELATRRIYEYDYEFNI